MKENKLKIIINKTAQEVFAFTTNPKNTPLWVDSFEVEETNEWPIKIGTIYRNKSKVGGWNECVVSNLIKNEIFELTSGDYHVKYTYKDLANGTSEMEYYEWVDKGEIDGPFTIEVLEKLRMLIENNKLK